MPVELNPVEREILDAAKEGNGCDISRLMQEIPVKEWQQTINHLNVYKLANTREDGIANLGFDAFHPWKSERPGEPVSFIDMDSVEVSIGIYPSPNLFGAVADLKTGKIDEKPMCRNFKF